MPKCAHIYAFVQRSSTLSPTKRLFYVGSSIAIHDRLVTHVESLFKAQSLSKPTEVYEYINSHVGESKFDVFIVDNEVPLGSEKAFERIYYDLMMSQGYQLQNMNKPVPEDSGLLSNFDVMRGATNKLSEFVARVFDGTEMTTEELILNELKKHTIKSCRFEHQDQMKTGNDNLKKINKELRGEVSQLRESNEVLQNDLDKTNKMCSLLEELKALKDSQLQVEVQEAVVEVKDVAKAAVAEVKKAVRKGKGKRNEADESRRDSDQIDDASPPNLVQSIDVVDRTHNEIIHSFVKEWVTVTEADMDYLVVGDMYKVYLQFMLNRKCNVEPLIKLRFKEKIIGMLPGYKNQVNTKDIGHVRNVWIGCKLNALAQ